jgi:hypothetical protein
MLTEIESSFMFLNRFQNSSVGRQCKTCLELKINYLIYMKGYWKTEYSHKVKKRLRKEQRLI